MNGENNSPPYTEFLVSVGGHHNAVAKFWRQSGLLWWLPASTASGPQPQEEDRPRLPEENSGSPQKKDCTGIPDEDRSSQTEASGCRNGEVKVGAEKKTRQGTDREPESHDQGEVDVGQGQRRYLPSGTNASRLASESPKGEELERQQQQDSPSGKERGPEKVNREAGTKAKTRGDHTQDGSGNIAPVLTEDVAQPGQQQCERNVHPAIHNQAQAAMGKHGGEDRVEETDEFYIGEDSSDFEVEDLGQQLSDSSQEAKLPTQGKKKLSRKQRKKAKQAAVFHFRAEAQEFVPRSRPHAEESAGSDGQGPGSSRHSLAGDAAKEAEEAKKTEEEQAPAETTHAEEGAGSDGQGPGSSRHRLAGEAAKAAEEAKKTEEERWPDPCKRAADHRGEEWPDDGGEALPLPGRSLAPPAMPKKFTRSWDDQPGKARGKGPTGRDAKAAHLEKVAHVMEQLQNGTITLEQAYRRTEELARE